MVAGAAVGRDLSMFGYACTVALALLSLRAAAGPIELEIISPAPCSKETDGKCDCLYQALINERVSFVAVVRTDLKLDMRFAFLTNSLRQPLDNCTITDCRADPRCSHFCNTTEAITREISFEKYLISASPYKQIFGDATKTLCIQVNETSSLLFYSYPGHTLSSLDGNVTLSYEARGYPMPTAYQLDCDGREAQRNDRGVFHLVGLPNGQLSCYATAENRVSRVVSRVTQISVIRPSTAAPPPTTSPRTGEVIGHDRQTQVIVGAITGVGVVVVLLIVIPIIVRKAVRGTRKTPLSVVNIHNDHSYHTTYVHNGTKVESYGPNSTVVMSSAAAHLLDSHSNSEQQHGWDGCSFSAGNLDPGVEAYELIDSTATSHATSAEAMSCVDGGDGALR